MDTEVIEIQNTYLGYKPYFLVEVTDLHNGSFDIQYTAGGGMEDELSVLAMKNLRRSIKKRIRAKKRGHS